VSAKRILLILFGLFSVAIIAIAVVLAIAIPRWVEGQVHTQAKARGFEIQAGEISFGWQWVQISDATISLIGVPEMTSKVGVIDVQLSGFEPQRVTVNRVAVDAAGDLLKLATALESWRSAHAKDLHEPLAMKPFTLRAATSKGAPPVVLLDGGELTLASDRVTSRATSFTAFGHALGGVTLLREPDHVRVGFTLGQSALENPTLSLEQTGASARAFHLALAPIPLAKLGAALGVELPLAETVLSGTLDVNTTGAITPLSHFSGRADFTLKGYIPPHPIELDGFVFGDSTTLSSKFEVEPELLRVRFSELAVKAGSFELKGEGELRLEALDHGRLTASLRGSLPCAALAAAAAQSRLGQALGRLTGKAALQTLSGGVGVRVAVDADTRELEKARVLKTITPGCGLKPLTLAELQALGELAPGALDPAVLRDLDALLKGPLPTLPNLGPGLNLKLPALPRFPALPSKPAASSKPATSPAKPAAGGRSGR
jgi:hypothetical protein